MTKPKLSREEVLAKLEVAGLQYEPVAVYAKRGYYLNTMGKAGENDRGIYDDAIFIVGPEFFAAYNANVDPSAFRKGIAVLKPGTWWYKAGIHGLSKPKAQQYQAFVQAKEVTVLRDSQGSDTGFFGINIHRGGVNTTSSLGCQTIPPTQWEAFRAALMDQLDRVNRKVFPYHLED